MSLVQPEIIGRFWSKVDKNGPNGCWIWLAGKNQYGYGKFTTQRGFDKLAHRYSYELVKGKIPDGLTIDHLCRNRACVNPAHLEAVTNRTNLLRGMGVVAVNARKTHCKNGHELSGDNLVRSGLKLGQRICRICDNEWKKKHHAQKRSHMSLAEKEEARRYGREYMRRRRAEKHLTG